MTPNVLPNALLNARISPLWPLAAKLRAKPATHPLAALFVLVGLLAAGPSLAAEKPLELNIAAGQIDEICLPMTAGQTVHWRFTADVPVDFNLHHHVGKKVLLPVDVKATRSHEGKWVIDTTNDWCLMWTAPKQAPAAIRGGFATDDIVR